MSQQLCIHLPRDFSAFAELEPALQQWLAANSVASRSEYVVRLVLEEILMNLIKHGIARPEADGIEVGLAAQPDGVQVRIEDDGQPFDPRQGPPLNLDTPLEERSRGGMGLHLVQTLVDQLSYEHVGGRNRLLAYVARDEKPAQNGS